MQSGVSTQWLRVWRFTVEVMLPKVESVIEKQVCVRFAATGVFIELAVMNCSCAHAFCAYKHIL